MAERNMVATKLLMENSKVRIWEMRLQPGQRGELHKHHFDHILVQISGDRMEVLLRAILRAGAYELHHHAKIPAAVLINDYVDVAHAFFDAKEPGLVNGVLDKLAKSLRS